MGKISKQEYIKQKEMGKISKEEYNKYLDDLKHPGQYIPETEVLIRYHRELFPELPDVEKHGNFYDLCTAEDYELKAGEFTLLNLGVSIKLPSEYWAMLVPRSSTYKKYHIIQTNSMGVIDTEYCGDDDIWMMPVYATQDTFIPKNTRICQFTLQKEEPFSIKPVDKLTNKNRGGFGSTGV